MSFHVRLRRRFLASITCAAALGALAAGPAALPVAAHVVEHAGTFTLEIGWQHEPTYVGEANGIQVIVHDGSDKPVNDLAADALKVVVSTAGQSGGELTFEPGFDLEEGLGTQGEYDAAILPTAPGDYTFHLTGDIRGQKVDITVASSDSTFDPVKGTTDIEFPTKLPTTPEIVTRLDRIDSRIATLQGVPTTGALDDVRAQADAARQSADRALLLGTGIGLVGLFVGAAGLLYALRTRRLARA